MTFVTGKLVRFAHVDAAGIVFYPRYFEMLNGAVEDWFEGVAGVSMKGLHLDRRLGIPTVKLDTEFVAPSRLGDMLQFHMDVSKLGRSSIEFVVDIRCGAETRFRVRSVLVCIDLDAHRSVPWPEDMRPAMEVAAAAVAA